MLTARYLMIGGFLGAGKTTAIQRIAECFRNRGQRIGLITNDQSSGLVDTTMLRATGFPTEEITGGCFCCKFNSLVEAADQLFEEFTIFVENADGSTGSFTFSSSNRACRKLNASGEHARFRPQRILTGTVSCAGSSPRPASFTCERLWGRNGRRSETSVEASLRV